MTGRERERLRALIDQRRRELVQIPDPSAFCDKPGISRYRAGCHCPGCVEAATVKKRRERDKSRRRRALQRA